jgi:hypothetical protein
LFTRCGPPTLEPFDFLARLALHAQLSQAVRRLPIKYPLRHLLNRLIKFAPGLYKWTKKSGAAAGQNLVTKYLLDRIFAYRSDQNL